MCIRLSPGLGTYYKVPNSHDPASRDVCLFISVGVSMLTPLLSTLSKFQALLPTGTYNEDIRTLNSFVHAYIEEALSLPQDELEKRSKAEDGYTFLHAIASYTRDRDMLRDQIVAVLLAGRDTTACTLSWLFYELSKHPQVVKKLRQEVHDTVGLEGNPMPTYENLKKMRYLQVCRRRRR